MLDFFRKYQWYFFLVITIIVIISFSFFGTYRAMGSSSWKEQIAFTAIDGREVTRSEEEELSTFLATDTEDARLYGGAWGFNFLNDGVIRKDFLQTGLAQELLSFYQAELREDLDKRLAKEKRYKPYVHPQARFLSTENAWNYFIPEMTNYFQALKNTPNSTDPQAFAARTQLFLTEKKFPPHMLRQVLRYQERQYQWLTPDPTLDRIDLSLFGYHTLEDWFGPRFTRLISQFIINAAMLAEEKGYRVSNAEVLADLVRSTEVSYQQNRNSPNLGVATPQEYFNEQLRRLNMDQGGAIRVWRQVMLFRRYFHDVGNAALVDTISHQTFNDFSKQTALLDLYRLPAELRLSDYGSLQNFEIYLNAVAKVSKDDPLALPKTFFTVDEVSKKYPELVQKRYLLEITQANKKNLQARVGIKEMWNWEVNDQNWAKLKKQFPDLGVKKDSTREERFAALDGLDSITRSKVDNFAKTAIVDSHPEWLNQMLDSASPEVLVVGLRPEGGQTPFEGLKTKEKREALIGLFDKASLNETPTSTSPLYAFTADEQSYYRIKVIGRDVKPSILTFAEAQADSSLDQLRQRILEKHYLSIREQNPSAYQTEDKSWKSFESVRDLVADNYFDKTLKALQKIQKTLTEQEKETFSKDQAASLRFYTYLEQAKKAIEKDPLQAAQFVRSKPANPDTTKELLQREPLANQWLIEKEEHRLDKNRTEEVIDAAEAYALAEQAWSVIRSPANGDIVFYQVKEKGTAPDAVAAMAEKIQQAHAMLSAEAQRILMRHILQQIVEKNAISLAYLNVNHEESQLPDITPEF